jgi:poly-gamma-glutamate synthesis protein (capsule biosynthesis protein)
MKRVTLFVCGDVMIGRGIDQIQVRPSDPTLHEDYIRSAVGYVHLAEQRNGPIPRGVGPDYIWGDALEELRRSAPQARVVNLETAVTTSDQWLDKGINYRMHPANIGCLGAARVDCCSLANNHVLDWGVPGLEETVRTLRSAGIRTSGAGTDLRAARAPAILELAAGQRLLVFGYAAGTSGVPRDWAASESRPGVNFLDAVPPSTLDELIREIGAWKRPGDLVLASIHWGSNWGFRISGAEQTFARRLLDVAGVDLVHGHSSHHVKGIEVHGGKLILYGCGDLINDYEGIDGDESYRGDLGLMYFPELDAATGALVALRMVPMTMRRFRLERCPVEDAGWLASTLSREGKKLGTGADVLDDGRLNLTWR